MLPMSEFWNNVKQGFSPEDLKIISESWQFVQVLALRAEDKKEDLTPPTSSLEEPHFLEAFDSSWIIQYWLGDENLASMMTCSSGNETEGLALQSQEGTEIAKASKAAITMVHYAHLKKWPGIKILDGSEFLKWVIWATCKSYSLPCEGYEANAEDNAKQERCDFMLSEFKKQPELVYSLAPFSMGGDSQSDQDDP